MATTDIVTPARLAPSFGAFAIPARTGGFGGRLLGLLVAWDARYRDRRHIETLDRSALADCGIAADGAAGEARKPFWRP